MNFKKTQLLNEFYYIRLSNLRFVEAEHNIFHLKYSFCCPICYLFDSAARGGRIAPPLSTTPLTTNHYTCFCKTINWNGETKQRNCIPGNQSGRTWTWTEWI